MVQALLKEAIAYKNEDKVGLRCNTYYIGGSLCIDVLPSNPLIINVSNQEAYYAKGASFKLSEREMYYACKLYLKHKDKSHAFYQQAWDFVIRYDGAISSNN